MTLETVGIRRYALHFSDLRRLIQMEDTVDRIGKIENVIGMTIEASGLRGAVGDICIINDNGRKRITAEIVGFRNDRILLMPYDKVDGIAVGDFVQNTGKKMGIFVGEFLKGRIIDALGNPIDGGRDFANEEGVFFSGSTVVNPLTRPPIRERLDFGVKAIDGLLTIGKGQRIGIFSGSGVGKSTLLGMVARNSTADINVIALVGERGREVLEFVQKDLGEEGLRRSVLVVATSDQPAMMRMKCPQVATAVAEFFRNQGLNVLLMMDSLTRFAMAQREVGLAIGEPPIARGYTPSIYAELPVLLERSGNFEKGSITGIYTVLVEGDDTNEPIADTVRGILDGHIILNRRLAGRNHFPAIDIGASISRLMESVVDTEHMQLASRMRDDLGVYQQNEDLVTIGAYKPGANARLDDALSRIDAINQFLKQGTKENFTREEILSIMEAIYR